MFKKRSLPDERYLRKNELLSISSGALPGTTSIRIVNILQRCLILKDRKLNSMDSVADRDYLIELFVCNVDCDCD